MTLDRQKFGRIVIGIFLLSGLTIGPFVLEFLALVYHADAVQTMITSISIILIMAAACAGFLLEHYHRSRAKNDGLTVAECKDVWCGFIPDHETGLIHWGGFTLTYIILPLFVCNLFGAHVYRATLPWYILILAHSPLLSYAIGAGIAYAYVASQVADPIIIADQMEVIQSD